MLKKTEQEHVQYQDIEKALQMISEIADKINLSQIEAENCQEMFKIQQTCRSEKFQLIMPHRKLIQKYEVMSKFDKIVGNRAFLFNDSILFIVYYIDELFDDYLFIPFEEYFSVKDEGDEDFPFHFSCNTPLQKVVVMCSSEEVKKFLLLFF